jgi:hypothetical protein
MSGDTRRIDPDKILKYLLNETSQAAAGKNKFFRGVGFSPERWKVLEQALLEHPTKAVLESIEVSQYGEKHIYRCNIPPAPNGREYCIRTVWQKRDGIFWFLSAYPRPD